MSDRPRIPRLPMGILLVLAAAIAAVQLLDMGDRGMSNALTMVFILLGSAITLIWWAFLSGRSWNTRLTALGALAAAIVAFGLLFEFVGWRSEMVPMFRARWAAPEAASVGATGTGTVADLMTTTPYETPSSS